MSDNLEQRLDRLGERSLAGQTYGPPPELLTALGRRRSERSTQFAFILGAASLVAAAACITLVVVFSGVPPAVGGDTPVVVVPPAPPTRNAPISTFAVGHGLSALNAPESDPALPASSPQAATPREPVLSVGSIHSPEIADGLLSSL